MKKISFFLILCMLSAAPAWAATYTMAVGSRPACSTGWSGSGPYTCTGTITLNGGDSIAPPGAVVINGNIGTNGGSIGLTNVTLNGNIPATAGPALTVTLNNSTINGNVSNSSNTLTISGGVINGNVSGGGSGVSLTNVAVTGNVSSSVNTVTINGGSVKGSISSGAGNPNIVINNATVTDGNITGTGGAINISNSTLGSSAGNVNVTGNNFVNITDGSIVYGSVTSGNWAAALNVDSSSFIFGTCTSSSNSVSNPPQYPRCSGAALLAEWRMDETSWDSNDNTAEVRDSVGSRHGSAAIAVNGGARPITATGSAAYTSANGSLSTCRYGQFDRTSNPARRYGYIQLFNFPTLPAQFTFAGWIRTTDRSVAGQRILVNDDNQDGWALSLGDAGDGMVRFFNRNLRRTGNITGSGSNSACGTNSGDPFCLDTTATISNNTWYFVAVAVDTATKRITLYVFNQDGSLRTQVGSAYTSNWANGSGAVSIGGESSASSEGQSEDFHFKGNLDEIKVYGMALNESALQAELTRARSCTASVNHIRIRHDGEGLTCSPELVTVEACADANCTSLYSGPVTLNLAPGGAGVTFTGSTTTALVSRTTIGQATLAATDVNPGVISATRCFNGTTETCLMNFVDSGFLVNVPAHAAETSQPISIRAVKKADSGVACVPAFQNTSKTVKLACAYVNPAAAVYGGRVAVRINNSSTETALNASNNPTAACDAGGANVSLNFDATGTATPTLKYADVGQMALVASTTLATTDDMIGSATFVVVPASFVFDTITASPIKAGSMFSARVSARNALNAVTPGFSRETPVETVELKSVTAAAASAGNSQLVGPTGGVSGTLTNDNKGLFTRATCSPASNGTVCSNTLAWTEVGNVNLVAAGKSAGGYLGSGLTPWGMTAVRFIPAFFETAFDPINVQGCGSFTYSGQPFRLTVTARSQANTELGSTIATTQNYTGTHAKAVTLGSGSATECTPTTTNFANNTLASADFLNGVARTPPTSNIAAPLPITYTQALGQPSSVTVCAKETAADGVNSHGQLQAALAIRSGRLRLFNAFGSARLPLEMQVQAQYWTGNSWIQNSLDSCTSLGADRFFLSNNLSSVTQPLTISVGAGMIRLAAPTGNVTTHVDVAANLGTSGPDRSCLNTHGASPGSLPWLRSTNGNNANCPGGPSDRDPSARASFGIYSPEGQRIIHMREAF